MIATMRLSCVLFALFAATIATFSRAGVAIATMGPGAVAATEIALTHRGDSWWISAAGIERRSATGDSIAVFRTDAAGLGSIERFAVSPHDASLWAVTDAHRFVHVQGDGIRSSASLLPASAASLALGQNGEAWVATADTVLRFSAEGRPMGTIALDARSEAPAMGRAALQKHGIDRAEPAWRQILVDSLRDRAWIVEAQRLTRVGLEMSGVEASVQLPTGCAARSAALDALHGSVFVLCERDVVMFDTSGSEASRLALTDVEPGTFTRLAYDSQSAELIVSGTGVALRIGAAERGIAAKRLELRGKVDPSLGAVHPAPFRIEPAVTLFRPPDGGATWDERQEIVFSVGAQCPSGTCSAPDAYVAGLRIAATVNGVARQTSKIDTVTKRAGLSADGALRAGANRIEAEVRDRFGHVGRMRAASLTLLTASGEFGPSPHAPVAKAANKPPVVALTAPSPGSVFTTGGDITVSATASDSDGTIARVEFYRGSSTLIGTASAPPYAVVWPKAIAGGHSLTARAFDDRKASTTSAPVTINVVDNNPPSVTVTKPADGTFLATGSRVTLEADPRDVDGSITRLEFFDGTTSLAALSGAPWTWTWAVPPVGSHAITARATDNRGAIATSAVVSLIVGTPPRVVVSAPPSCTAADAPIDLLVTVDVYSASDAIASVELFDGSTPVYGLLQPPWRFLIANVGVGAHSFTARATDARGLATTSRPAQFEVRAANQPPVVAITVPAEAATLPFGAPVTLTADASDSDGTIASVRFQTSAGYVIGSATQAPYRVTWTGVAAGAYTIFALATDDRGATTASAPAHFSVAANLPPAVSLTAPVGGATYGAPATISLAASASDPDGAIARVEFYAGATLVGTDTSEPYTYEWNGVAAGAYSLTARAYDSSRTMTASAPVAVTVAANVPPTVALAQPASGASFDLGKPVPLAVSVSDVDGTIARVEFRVDGVAIATVTEAPYAFSWSNGTAGSHTLVAVATDNVGATTTSATVLISIIGEPTLTLASIADGISVADDNVTISGTIDAPPNSAVAVNGTLAQLDGAGHFDLNAFQLVPGENVLEVVLFLQGRGPITRTVNVTSTGTGPFTLDVTPTEGFAPLDVAFTVTNRGGLSFARVEFDFDGDGRTDYIANATQFVEQRFGVIHTYPVGRFTSTVKVFDLEGRPIHSATRILTVRTIDDQNTMLRGIYDGMLRRLREGDIDAALTAVSGTVQQKYRAVFEEIGLQMATVIDTLGTFEPGWFSVNQAEYTLTRDSANGAQGFLIEFVRGKDGIWRIEGM